MGLSLLSGWLHGGFPARSITVHDPFPSERLLSLARESGIAVNPERSAKASILVLAVKPQAAAQAAAGYQNLVKRGTLIISIMAGIDIDGLKGLFPRAGAIVRAMPNLPASVGWGATAAVASPGCSEKQREWATALLAGAAFVWVEREEQMDAVTAVSGSGPGYVFRFVECLARAGEDAGLPPRVAETLARATVSGAGQMLHLIGDPADRLRKHVTSPGGTTAAGLAILMEKDELGDLLRRAVAASAKRSRELASG